MRAARQLRSIDLLFFFCFFFFHSHRTRPRQSAGIQITRARRFIFSRAADILMHASVDRMCFFLQSCTFVVVSLSRASGGNPINKFDYFDFLTDPVASNFPNLSFHD
jgi:hypothetical protein